MSPAPSKYDSIHVALHWLTAALIIFMLVMGTFSLAETPNSSPDKLFALGGHMILGGTVLVLTIVRLIRLWTRPRPPHAATGNKLLDKLGIGAHHLLYLLILLVAASGIGTALLSGLPGIVFGGNGELPPDFHAYPPRFVHGIATKLLAALVLLHGAGALYHQFVLKDRLFARMWFGRG
ncbi:MAG: cytochrome B [Hyphomicrobiales bacterium]|nr:MAG: cytochrome B [Hyphomicrobiales bacterium]